jgi:hypothetical protein
MQAVTAKQEKIEQRKLDALMKTDRASETRRKILAGALIIQIMEKDEAVSNGVENFPVKSVEKFPVEL